MNFETSATKKTLGALRPFYWKGVSQLVSVVLLVLCSLVVFTGCVRHEPRADIVIVNGIEPESLDPAIITGVAEMRIVSSLFEGLTRLDPVTAEPIPGLAEKWEISPDGRIYTFHMRTNLQWSTGEPITTDDVVYSWLRALDPNTASDYAGQLFYLVNGEAYTSGKIKDTSKVGVHALDRYTLRVELNNPTAFFLDLCAFPTLAVVPRQCIEKYGDRWLMARPLPVSGAYTLEAWRINDKIRVRKNPRYWDAANTKTDLVDFLPIGSPTTALNLYETGGTDIVWDKDLVPVELLDVLLKRPDFHVAPILGTYFIRFNVNKKPFNDVRVRQALALSLNKERITKNLPRRERNRRRIILLQALPAITLPKAWGTIRRRRGSSWRKLVFRAARDSRVLNICSMLLQVVQQRYMRRLRWRFNRCGVMSWA